jgi:hypothetical protein
MTNKGIIYLLLGFKLQLKIILLTHEMNKLLCGAVMSTRKWESTIISRILKVQSPSSGAS